MRGTTSFNVGGPLAEEPENWREGILFLHPNPAPLTAFLSRLDSEVTSDPAYHWFEEVTPDQRVIVVGAQTSADTSLVLAALSPTQKMDPNVLKPGTILMNERTLEQMLVTGYNSGTLTVTVLRARGSVAAAAMLANDALLITGTSYAEGDVAAQAMSFQPSLFTNYTQIFKDSFFLTRTALNTRFRTGAAYQQEKIRTLRNHAIQIEKSLLFGQSSIATGANGQPQRTTSGMITFIKTNVQDFAGTVTGPAWNSFLETAFRYGADEKLFLCGGIALNTLNQLTQNKATINVVPLGETFGYRLYEYGTPFGTLFCYKHPLLSTNPSFQGWGFIIDLSRIRERYITQTRLEQNVQAQGTDARQDQYLSELGLEVHHELSHGLVKGMLAAA